MPCLALLLLGVVGYLYYVPYIESRERALDDRAFSVLATLSDQLGSQISNLGLVLRQAVSLVDRSTAEPAGNVGRHKRNVI